MRRRARHHPCILGRGLWRLMFERRFDPAWWLPHGDRELFDCQHREADGDACDISERDSRRNGDIRRLRHANGWRVVGAGRLDTVRDGEG